MNRAPYLTLRDVAERLKLPTDRVALRRLRRELERRQRATRVKFLLRGEGRTSPIKTTLALLREGAPEIFEESAPGVRGTPGLRCEVRDYLAKAVDRINDVEGRVKRLERQR